MRRAHKFPTWQLSHQSRDFLNPTVITVITHFSSSLSYKMNSACFHHPKSPKKCPIRSPTTATNNRGSATSPIKMTTPNHLLLSTAATTTPIIPPLTALGNILPSTLTNPSTILLNRHPPPPIWYDKFLKF